MFPAARDTFWSGLLTNLACPGAGFKPAIVPETIAAPRRASVPQLLHPRAQRRARQRGHEVTRANRKVRRTAMGDLGLPAAGQRVVRPGQRGPAPRPRPPRLPRARRQAASDAPSPSAAWRDSSPRASTRDRRRRSAASSPPSAASRRSQRGAAHPSRCTRGAMARASAPAAPPQNPRRLHRSQRRRGIGRCQKAPHLVADAFARQPRHAVHSGRASRKPPPG